MKFFAFLFLVSLVSTESCSTFLVDVTERELDGPVKQTLFADSEYLQIYILTSMNSVYKSTNGGESWQLQMTYMVHSDEIQPIYNQSGVQKMFSTSIDGHVLFLGFGYQYWTTNGEPQSYSYYYNPTKPWSQFIPNSSKGDVVLGLQFSDSCLETNNCNQNLKVSTNWGETWSTLQDYVYSADWADEDSIYFISVPSNEQSGLQYQIDSEEQFLYRVKSDGEILLEKGPGYFDFTNVNDVLYAVYTVNSTVSLHVSQDQGETFQEAIFSDSLPDLPLDVNDYSLLDNSEGVTFLHVNRANSIHYGTLYEANTDDAEFWPSLRNNRLSPGTHNVDFSSVDGLQGIYIANQYNTSLLADENDEAIITQISLNKGGSWFPLAIPTDSTCSSPECSLHLQSTVDGEVILSDENVPGLILALGNEGIVREIRNDNINLYLSRNGGVSWDRVQSGPRKFNWGNFGSFFVSSSSLSATDEISFSWNQGLSWDACSFSSNDVEVEEILQIGSSDSLRFLVLGSSDVGGSISGFVFHLDFSNNLSTMCVGQSSPGEQESDFEQWSTQWDGQCLLGESTTYTRRKRDSICYVTGEDFAISHEPCECTKEDYICDGACWVVEKTENGTQCVYQCGDTYEAECNDGVELVTQGYRLVVGDTCAGGLDLTPNEEDCQDRHSEFTAGWLSWILLLVFFILVGITLLFLVLLFLYHKNDKVYAKLNPMIPEWCTRNPSLALDDLDDENYGHLDTSTSTSVLDDDDDIFSF